MATLEARVMRDSHVMLVSALKACCTSVAGDLFGEYLINEDVKAAMSLNIPDQEKAEKLRSFRSLSKIDRNSKSISWEDFKWGVPCVYMGRF